MASLTSQQINDTYKGLIKLADATTGITSSLQSIQDGLGNDLPLKVKEGQIQGQNIFSFGYFVPDYEGPGFTGTGTQYPAGTQNKLNMTPFYNPGLNSFSAITYRVITATTVSDSVQLSFYTAQYVNGRGYQPKDLVMSGITLEAGTTGLKVTALPSTLSFSGYGSGIYIAVVKVSNSGVQPTIRYGALANTNSLGVFSAHLGMVMNTTNDGVSMIQQTASVLANSNGAVYSTLADFQTSFAPGDFSGGILASTYAGLGFALNVIK
jgi:hypothetical protein